MVEDADKDFTCPNCQAHYNVVRVKAEPGKTYRAIHCGVCRAVLAGTDGNDILKYFLVRRHPRNH